MGDSGQNVAWGRGDSYWDWGRRGATLRRSAAKVAVRSFTPILQSQQRFGGPPKCPVRKSQAKKCSIRPVSHRFSLKR